ncbi:MAG: hypothetical protein IPM78_13390 [Moraxellaceae bacterium]|nr:hypothetical protein [Moraxellaceae bacterium]
MINQIKLSVHSAIIEAAKLKMQYECVDSKSEIDLKKYALDIVEAIKAADNHEYLKQPISNP